MRESPPQPSPISTRWELKGVGICIQACAPHSPLPFSRIHVDMMAFIPILKRQACHFFHCRRKLLCVLFGAIILYTFIIYIIPTDHALWHYCKIDNPLLPNDLETRNHTCALISRKLANVRRTKHGIPYILHQIYADDLVPIEYVPYILSCQNVNKDFVHMLWTEHEGQVLLSRHYPYLRQLYFRYDQRVERADVLRLVILYHFGGVYIDMDVECRKSFSQSLDQFNSSFILDREIPFQAFILWRRKEVAMNSAMMVRPRHPFIKYLLEKLVDNFNKSSVVHRTGPIFITNSYRIYSKLDHPGHTPVLIASSSAFSPLADPQATSAFRRRCFILFRSFGLDNELAAACRDWYNYQERWCYGVKNLSINPISANAILIHHFRHLAYEDGPKVRHFVNICKIAPNLYRLNGNEAIPVL